MKRLAKRTIASMLLVVLLLAGFGLYTIKFFMSGDDWVAFGVNRHAYSNGVLATGTILDRNGMILASVENSSRVYNENTTVRRATMHVVGDTGGNVGTGLLYTFDTQLMSYNAISGLYSLSGEGNTVKTSLDADLCTTAYQALAGRKGAVVVYNYITGEVICMVSSPNFDPQYPPEITDGDPAYDGVYLNRALSSTFTPGSIFKVVTLYAALENLPELYDLRFQCTGSYAIGYDQVTCTRAHGELDIHDALAVSCNCAFAEISLLLGGDTIARYADKAGLLDRFEMSGIPVAAGRFDVADDGSSDLAWSGIGQYNDLVNPLAAARFMGAIANGGSVVNPRMVTGVTTQIGLPTGLYGRGVKTRLLSQTTADTLKEMMRYNVTSYYGESTFPGLNICAKSGTAEVGEGITPHAWFVGFLDDAANPYAFAVVVENGGWGLTAAGSVANQVLQQAVS